MTAADYSVQIAFSPVDGEYVATAEEWPGLSGLGSTKASALAALEQALTVVITSLEHERAPLPAPLTKQMQDAAVQHAQHRDARRSAMAYADAARCLGELRAVLAGATADTVDLPRALVIISTWAAHHVIYRSLRVAGSVADRMGGGLSPDLQASPLRDGLLTGPFIGSITEYALLLEAELTAEQARRAWLSIYPRSLGWGVDLDTKQNYVAVYDTPNSAQREEVVAKVFHEGDIAAAERTAIDQAMARDAARR